MKQEEENIIIPQSSESERETPKKKEKKDKKKSKKDSDSKKSEKKKKEKSDKKKKEEKNKKKEKKESKKEKKEKKEIKEENESTENSSETIIDSDSSSYSNSDSIFVADSLAIDSSLVKVDTTSTKKDTVATVVPPAYLSGNNPVARINHPGHDSGIMILITITFILISFTFNHYSRMLVTYGQDLWNVRRRVNAFNEHTTNEHYVIAILIFQLCVFAGILISAKINTLIPMNNEKITITTYAMMGVYGLYYLFQLATYSLVGYVFTDKINSSQWIKGFNASHIFLGFTLIIPTMVSIFYPTTTDTMVSLSIGLYVIARLTFIFKGFRIFYNKIYSLFYFILYLCTLEIIPVIFMYGIAQKIFGNLQ